MKQIFLVLLVSLLLCSLGMGQIPFIISHQGYLADSTGSGVTGILPMTFRIYSDSIGGPAHITQVFPGVALTKGVFNVNIDVSEHGNYDLYWLETEVNGQTLAPRTRLTSTQYSLFSYYSLYTKSPQVGESYGGGIVFWITDNGKHGLIASLVDQSDGVAWHNGTDTITNAIRDGWNAGMYNTERIIAAQGAGNYAAQVCANYQGGGYGDWYLPSASEMSRLNFEKDIVGGFFYTGNYWCSNENGVNQAAWIGLYGGLNQTPSYAAKLNLFRVRAIRAF